MNRGKENSKVTSNSFRKNKTTTMEQSISSSYRLKSQITTSVSSERTKKYTNDESFTNGVTLSESIPVPVSSFPSYNGVNQNYKSPYSSSRAYSLAGAIDLPSGDRLSNGSMSRQSSTYKSLRERSSVNSSKTVGIGPKRAVQPPAVTSISKPTTKATVTSGLGGTTSLSSNSVGPRPTARTSSIASRLGPPTVWNPISPKATATGVLGGTTLTSSNSAGPRPTARTSSLTSKLGPTVRNPISSKATATGGLGGTTPSSSNSVGIGSRTAARTPSTTSRLGPTGWNPISSKATAIGGLGGTTPSSSNSISISPTTIRNPINSELTVTNGFAGTTSPSLRPSTVVPSFLSRLFSSKSNRKPTLRRDQSRNDAAAAVEQPSPSTSRTTVKQISRSVSMKPIPGKVYIFNNENFNNSNTKRTGSECDVRLLKETFEKLNFDIYLGQDLTKAELKSFIATIQRDDFEDTICTVFVILSHGTTKGYISAKDGEYNLDEMFVYPIIANKSLTLKPKIFIVQACRGTREPGGFEYDASLPNGYPINLLLCYSTYEGYIACRRDDGTPFIQSFCKNLSLYGKQEDILKIMKRVTKSVGQITGNLQVPVCHTSLTEQFKLGQTYKYS